MVGGAKEREQLVPLYKLRVTYRVIAGWTLWYAAASWLAGLGSHPRSRACASTAITLLPSVSDRGPKRTGWA